MDSVEVVKVLKVFERRVWVETDIAGSCHVMVRHDDGESEPFCYCTFSYDYAHTSNAQIKEEARAMAVRLGAKEPVEFTDRPFHWPDSDSKSEQ